MVAIIFSMTKSQKIITFINSNVNFLRWQYHNKYFNKQFSILGDSISTLAGYNPKDYKVFYGGDNCAKSGVYEMKDTWWGKVIDFFGGELLVNNSWSDSRVTRLKNKVNLFPSGCSDERTHGLHINNINPDVIIIYLGTNDWVKNAEAGSTEFFEAETNMCCFSNAYSKMLQKIRMNYNNAEIWCCTLSTTHISSNTSFEFPYAFGGTHIEKYNQIIKDAADFYKCNVVDLYRYHIPYDSIDGTHPSVRRMNILASIMIREIGGEKFDFLINRKTI